MAMASETGTKEIEMDRIFPLYSVENGLIVSQKGDLTMGFSLQLPEIFTADSTQYLRLHDAFCRIVRLLPPDYILHKQDIFYKLGYKADYSRTDQDFLDRCSERFFHERPYLHHAAYLYISKRAGNNKAGNSAWSNLLHPIFMEPGLLSGKHAEELIMVAGQGRQILDDIGLNPRLINSSDYCGKESGGAESAEFSGDTGLLESYLMLRPGFSGAVEGLSDIEFKPQWRIADRYPFMFSIADSESLPLELSTQRAYEPYSSEKLDFPLSFSSPMGCLLPFDHIYNQIIIKSDRQQALKELESKRLRLFSLSAYSRKNGIASQDIQEYLNEAIQQGKDPVKAHFNIIAWANGPQDKREKIHRTASALSKAGILPKLETAGAPQIYWACLPGNQPALPLNECFSTFAEQACCLLCFESSLSDSASGKGMRLGERLTGRPLTVDLSDIPMKKGWITNRNKFILGPSGSGKSFFTNHMLRSYHQQGSHVVIVDVGHSYKGLCDQLSGYYFCYDEMNPISFNPFFSSGLQVDTEKRESIKSLLLALWKKDDEGFTRSEYVAISNALKGYFDHINSHPDIFPCFDSFYEFLNSSYRNSVLTEKIEKQDFDLENLLYVLRPYYRGGEFDFLLNARENLDLLSQRFIVFELDNIKDHPILFPVVTLIIMELFISKMRKLPGTRKIILIEEAWKAIAREGMAEYIRYLFKTVRKFFGEAIVVTQEVGDIISSPLIKEAIINNADCKILLDQSKFANRFGHIQELLGLGEKEKLQILSINKNNEQGRKYKEVFIGLGPVSKVYRCEVSPEEYLTYTTEQQEKEALRAAVQECGDRQKGLLQHADKIREQQKLP